MEQVHLEVEGAATVSLLKSLPTSAAGTLFIYAPGAGSNLNDPFGTYCAQRLLSAGVECWRFQFPYMETSRRAPDRTPVLESTWRSAIEAGNATGMKVIVGGRSMGGRIASQVVAKGAAVSAVVLFAYPLHPPGKPEQRRDQHLDSITIPTLFCSGTRDTFATRAELIEAAALAPRSAVHFLEGADHGFATLKSSGRSREDVWAESVDAMLSFLDDQVAV